MNEREPISTETSDTGVERAQGQRPEIYVASLSDYNAGRLHGRWLDAAVGPEDLQAGIDAMLAESRTPLAEEWAIHDHSGFGPLRIDEYDSLERVSAAAIGIAAHGEGFAAWAAHLGGDQVPSQEDFEEAYLGRHESLEAYAEQLVEDLGYDGELRDLPPHLQLYVKFDTEMFARDLELSGDVFTSEAATGGVHVFDGRS